MENEKSSKEFPRPALEMCVCVNHMSLNDWTRHVANSHT